MGSAIASNLIKSRFRVIGYDVVAAKRRALTRAGGAAAGGVEEAGAAADVVITSLPSSDALLDVAAALARSAAPPKYVVETSTLPITIKDDARARLAAVGTTLLDCPISGTGAQARTRSEER